MQIFTLVWQALTNESSLQPANSLKLVIKRKFLKASEDRVKGIDYIQRRKAGVIADFWLEKVKVRRKGILYLILTERKHII